MAMVSHNFLLTYIVSQKQIFNDFLVLDFLDRPLSTRLVFGPHYGRIGNGLEANRQMLQVKCQNH